MIQLGYRIGKYSVSRLWTGSHYSLTADYSSVEMELACEDPEEGSYYTYIQIVLPDLEDHYVLYLPDELIPAYSAIFNNKTKFSSLQEAKDQVEFFLVKLSKLKAFI